MITHRTFAWLAVAAMAFAVYVSLIPFNLQAVPFGAALEQFTFVVTTPTAGRVSRTNFLANLLLFVPIGFALAGALLVDRQWRPARLARAVTIVLAGALLVSLTAEFLQIFAPGRMPARSDIEAQAVGCAAGIAAWLVAGQWLTDWLRAAHSRSGTDRVAKALTAYAAVWIVVNLAPFDFTFDLGELAQRVRSGLITVMPFAGMARPTARIVWDVVISTVSAIPLGALGAAAAHQGRRRAGLGLVVGGAIVLGVEAVQVFTASHAADGTDVLFGWLGVVAGALVSARLLDADTTSQTTVQRDAKRRWSGWLLAAWCGVLLMYHWMPYDFSFDPALIRGKLAGMSLMPFSAYARGSDLNALTDLLVKLGLSAPLGLFGAYAVARDNHRVPATAGFALLAALILGVVEAGQLFLPSRTPEPTDVLVGVAGALGGLWVGRWVAGGRK